MNENLHIGAIMVLYNPDVEQLDKVVERLKAQVDEVCIVDNTPVPAVDVAARYPGIFYLPLGENKGIAAAQNEGIRHFQQLGYDYIIFADQDTVVSEDAVERLLATSLYLQSHGIIVGAVAPVAVRTQTGTPMSYKLVYLSDYNEHIMQVIQTMNSMSLIKLSLFDKVGLMDESLFIDGVDSEWCWRATKLVGATFYYDRNIQMTHQLGIATNKLLNREISIASPTRLYYQYRNYLWLMRRDYVPRQWLVRHGVKYFIKIFYYTIKGPNRRSYIKNIYNGIKAGIKNCP